MSETKPPKGHESAKALLELQEAQARAEAAAFKRLQVKLAIFLGAALESLKGSEPEQTDKT